MGLSLKICWVKMKRLSVIHSVTEEGSVHVIVEDERRFGPSSVSISDSDLRTAIMAIQFSYPVPANVVAVGNTPRVVAQEGT